MNTPKGIALPTPENWRSEIDGFADWMRAATNTSETVRTRLQHIRTFARAVEKAPREVTSADIVTWAAKQEWGAETRHAYYTTLKRFFAWRQSLGLGQENPALILPTIHRNVPPPRPVPEDVLRDILENVDGREKIMIELAAFAGLRCIEISRVHIDDIVSVPGIEHALSCMARAIKSASSPYQATYTRLSKNKQVLTGTAGCSPQNMAVTYRHTIFPNWATSTFLPPTRCTNYATGMQQLPTCTRETS